MPIFNKIYIVPILTLALTGCSNEQVMPNKPASNTIPTSQSATNLPNTSNVSQSIKIEAPSENYAKFSTYHWENRERRDIGAGGVLVEQNGCLFVQSGDILLVPLLPHEKTSWNESTKTLTFFNKKIKVGEKIFGGGSYNVEPSKPNVQYILKAKPECLEGRKFMVLWGA